MNPEVKIYPDKNTLIRESAAYISNVIQTTINEQNKCTFVLAGGSTPKGLYKTLASHEYREKVDWRKVHLFWGDERCVRPEHPESNYRMAKETLIDHIDIPQENVHRIPAEKEPAETAREYEETINRFFGDTSQLPVFDIILLGIGEDGHTASLFPGTEALEENKRWVTEVYVKKLNTHRITLTYPGINSGRNVIFLVAGSSKADIVRKVYRKADSKFPAVQVIPANGNLIYLLDKAAGKFLENTTLKSSY
jgi:6-phosphogluconolactonase